MDTNRLVKCLQECVTQVQLLPRGNLAIYLAYESGESMALVVGGNTTFARLLVEGRKVYPELLEAPKRAPSDLVNPHHGVERAHLAWLIEELHKLGDVAKQHRWFGFIDGSLDYRNIILNDDHAWTRVNWKGLDKPSFANRTIGQLILCAMREDGPYRSYSLIAHYALGYMQGVLWRAGKASIDDLRIMNKPPEEPFRARGEAHV